jgi:two-component system, OmpR family, phosphate regulon sensor histidine kinase PhoR
LNRALVRTLTALVWLAIPAALLRLAFGADAGWAFFACGLLILLGYHARNLGRLLDWQSRPDPDAVPGTTGIWDDAFAFLHRRERRHTQERQRLSRLVVRYGQAGRALPDGVVILDAENRIEWCNEKGERRFGIDGRADAGQPITNLVRQPEFVDYVAGGDYSRPLQLRTSRGAGLTLSIQIIPYDDSQKLLLARDITQAERLETMRRDFVANVSHELRTPLTVLAGFLETVRELKLDPDRSRNYMGMMADQAGRMQRIIDDLLTLSALESAPEPPTDQRVPMKAVLDRLCADAQALSAGRHVITLDAQGDFDLLGAEGEIAGALSNLVTNAVRYTPAGGKIRIIWRASEEGASFAVEDTGIGVEPDHIPRLTERFYRVDRGRSRDTGGTGLGLAIVKHALLRHQASLEIESEPGRGSRFTVRIPARRVAAGMPSPGVAA